MADNAKWYVVHTYSGHENKVKASLERIVESRNMQDIIQLVEVPMKEETDTKNGVKKTKLKKVFPGYVLVKMIMTDESWYVVRNTKGVTGFVGPGSKPVALTEREIKNMGIEEKLPELDVVLGEHLHIKEGPFTDQYGVVKSINKERRSVTLLVSMFGRETPVELEYEQVEKL